MLNKKLIKTVKIISAVILTIVVFTSGYLLGDGIRKNISEKTNEDSGIIKLSDKEIEKQLKDKSKDFLIAFYTKKDLGENRDRYRPFMTEGMYNSTVAEEDKPANKAYQGYIVDWELQDTELFINGDKLEVIANVSYKNTTLAIKDDRSKQNVKLNKSSYKIIFTKKDRTLLVNKMEQMLVEPVVEGR